jgi:hypothetical protein
VTLFVVVIALIFWDYTTRVGKAVGGPKRYNIYLMVGKIAVVVFDGHTRCRRLPVQ